MNDAVNNRFVIVHSNAQMLADVTAARWLLRIVDAQATRRPLHYVLTGGTMGIAVLASALRSPLVNAVDWSGVHLWWGDERFLKDGDGERNEVQAREALLGPLVKAGLLPEDNIHPIPAKDKWRSDPAEAAETYAAELARFAPAGYSVPDFDVALLGMGPDGHVASLFPEYGETLYDNGVTVSITDSPKPPAERVSLTFPSLNSAREVWLVVAGAEKAEKAAEALTGGTIDDVPAAGVHGRHRTLWLLDTAAADAP